MTPGESQGAAREGAASDASIVVNGVTPPPAFSRAAGRRRVPSTTPATASPWDERAVAARWAADPPCWRTPRNGPVLMRPCSWPGSRSTCSAAFRKVVFARTQRWSGQASGSNSSRPLWAGEQLAVKASVMADPRRRRPDPGPCWSCPAGEPARSAAAALFRGGQPDVGLRPRDRMAVRRR